MTLSFIIPLYNCEAYVADCLNGIYGSEVDERDFEVIIVNDGSKDNGPMVCQSFANEHSNLHLISQENQGASAARNAGLNVAKGEFVWFVDADDKLVPDFFRKMVDVMKHDSTTELFCFNHYRVFKDRTDTCIDYAEEKTIDGIQFYSGNASGFLWNKIYRRELISSTRFLAGTKNLEDAYFNLKVIPKAINIRCLTDIGYYYNNTNQASTSKDQSLRNLVKLNQDSLTIHWAIAKNIAQCNDKQRASIYKEMLNKSIAGHLYSLMRFYSPGYLRRNINKYRTAGFYPVPKTSHQRTNKFLLLANRKTLFVLFTRLYKLLT